MIVSVDLIVRKIDSHLYGILVLDILMHLDDYVKGSPNLAFLSIMKANEKTSNAN